MTKKPLGFSDKQWTEIFLFGFVIAFIWWLLHNWKHRPQSTSQLIPAVTPAPASSLPFIGLPPLTLPHAGTCNCSDCSVGTTSPGIAMIVAQTNAALASIQAGGVATLNKLASIGNESGYANFVVEPS